jgi:murein DD-endopeptidase MepM/ murein hydrolase activator NlpD
MAPLPEPPAESPAPVEWRSDAIVAAEADADVAWLRDRGLLVPVTGIALAQITDTYNEARDGTRLHHAVDILAPRGSEVLSACDGVVLRIGTNALGGNVVWTTDAERKFAYYYAHLERWAGGLHEGQAVSRGEVIGYVGTSGNAPKNTPHLHFQVLHISDAKRYSNGPPLNPLPFFTSSGVTR